jgi:hypothetical protein
MVLMHLKRFDILEEVVYIGKKYEKSNKYKQ